MAHRLPDLVRETSTSAGTSDFTLAGAVSGYRPFSSVFTAGDTFWYVIRMGAAFEVGQGEWVAPGLLRRATVLSSSNGDAKVSWGAGIKDVFVSLPGQAIVDMLAQLNEVGEQIDGLKAIRYDMAQGLTAAQQGQALGNIGALSRLLRYDATQGLTAVQQVQALNNLGVFSRFVRYDEAQSLTSGQQDRALNNIGANASYIRKDATDLVIGPTSLNSYGVFINSTSIFPSLRVGDNVSARLEYYTGNAPSDKNPMIMAGDGAMIVSNGSINTGGFVIGTWNYRGGMRIGAEGRIAMGSSRTVTGPSELSVTRGSGSSAAISAVGAVGGNEYVIQTHASPGTAAVGGAYVTGSATSWMTSSDTRLKLNQRPLTGAEGRVDALVLKEWDWVTGGLGRGVIAQEAARVYPEQEIIYQGSPGTMTPQDEGFAPWSVDYSKLVPDLLAVVQILMRRVADLESRLAGS